jgi:tRNA G18 (ribose-2'-O)-methylase SpoU
MRGYCGIGIWNGKTEMNVGGLWRSAYCLGANFIFTIGNRYKKQASDTVKAYRHIPLWRFEDFADFRAHIPYDYQLVGVELLPQSKPLLSFSHPERAIYILGPEDGSLSTEIIDACQCLVKFDSRFCLNVASAGTVILYDRQTKSAIIECE